MQDNLSHEIFLRLNKNNNSLSSTISEKDVYSIIQEIKTYKNETTADNILENQEEFTTLFFNAPIPCFILDDNFKIEKVNNYVEKYFKKINTKTNFTSFIPKDTLETFLNWMRYKEYLMNDLEINFKCYDNSTRRFQIKAINHPINKHLYFFILIDIQQQYEMKENLQHLVDKEMKKSSNQLEMLKEQSRLASMGELIEIIIHQWISPLNGIKVRTEFIKNECKKDRLDKKTIENYTQEQIDNINHLITTLKEFRDFLKPKGELQCVKLLKLITYVRMLLKDVLVKNNVILNIDIDENFCIHVHQNEFTHVFINLINNSIDAFVENKKRVRNIDIYTKKDLTGFSIVFKDNAGGVSDYTLERLFDRHYTTKEEGTGIGLYLVKNIVEKIGGEISAKNISDGLEFIIHIAD